MKRWTKTEKYLNMSFDEFNSLNEKELKKVVSTLAKTSNQRIKTINKSEFTSPAIRVAFKGGKGKFTVGGKNINQLRAEYIRAKTFLTSKSSTITGIKEIRRNVLHSLNERTNGKITTKQLDAFWDIYNKLIELNPNINQYYSSNQMQAYIANLFGETDNIDDILYQSNKYLQELYEENESLNDEMDISDLFDIGDN